MISLNSPDFKEAVVANCVPDKIKNITQKKAGKENDRGEVFKGIHTQIIRLLLKGI